MLLLSLVSDYYLCIDILLFYGYKEFAPGPLPAIDEHKRSFHSYPLSRSPSLSLTRSPSPDGILVPGSRSPGSGSPVSMLATLMPDHLSRNTSRLSTPSLKNRQLSPSPTKYLPYSSSPELILPSTSNDKIVRKVSPDRQQQLTDMGWNKQHLNDFHGFQSIATQNNGNEEKGIQEGSHTTIEWQNELARHILSMHASTTANTNLNSSKAILKFVDNKDGEANVMSIIDKTIFDERLKKKKEEEVAKKLKTVKTLNLSLNKGEKEGKTLNRSSHSSNSRSMNSIFNGNKNDIDNKKKIIDVSRSSVSSSSSRPPPLSSSQPTREEKRGSVSMVRSNLSTPQTRSMKTPLSFFPDGNEPLRAGPGTEPPGEVDVPLRMNGPPLCHPVWFIGTGDIYADWSLILGEANDGVKLQAQLKILYEHLEYKEYLGVVESILNRFVVPFAISFRRIL